MGNDRVSNVKRGHNYPAIHIRMYYSSYSWTSQTKKCPKNWFNPQSSYENIAGMRE